MYGELSAVCDTQVVGVSLTGFCLRYRHQKHVTAFHMTRAHRLAISWRRQDFTAALLHTGNFPTARGSTRTEISSCGRQSLILPLPLRQRTPATLPRALSLEILSISSLDSH
jgi:hypothetical protein